MNGVHIIRVRRVSLQSIACTSCTYLPFLRPSKRTKVDLELIIRHAAACLACADHELDC